MSLDDGQGEKQCPGQLRDHRGIAVESECHGPLKSMRARDEHAESTLERVGGNPRLMRSTFVAAKVEESVTSNSRVCQRSDPILATALAVAVHRASLGGQTRDSERGAILACRRSVPINALASSEAEGPALTPSIRQTALERNPLQREPCRGFSTQYGR